MKNFNEIENTFLEIDGNNASLILNFYYENLDYFSLINTNEEKNGIKILWIISSVIDSAYKQKDYGLLKKIVKPTINNFKKYSLAHNYDLKSDTIYKLVIFQVGTDKFNNRKYWEVIKLFKELLKFDNLDRSILDFYNESKFRYIKKIGRLSGLIGLSFLIVKYIIRIVLDNNGLDLRILGYLGALLLLGFAMVELFLKRSTATDTG
jgi:hypothetical protein